MRSDLMCWRKGVTVRILNAAWSFLANLDAAQITHPLSSQSHTPAPLPRNQAQLAAPSLLTILAPFSNCSKPDSSLVLYETLKHLRPDWSPVADFACPWPPYQVLGNTIQNNLADLGLILPFRPKSAKAWLSASKDYPVRFSGGVRCIKSDFTLPNLLWRRLGPPDLKS